MKSICKLSIISILVGQLFLFDNLGQGNIQEQGEQLEEKVSYTDRVLLIPIGPKALTKKSFFEEIKKTLSQAHREKASAIILKINTRGGLAWEVGKLAERLHALPVPVYAWIEHADKAGALLACAARGIYVTPEVTIGGEGTSIKALSHDLPLQNTEKTFLDILDKVKRIASENGHHPQVVEAFVKRERVLRLDTDFLVDEDTLLTLDAESSLRPYQGSPVYAEALVDSSADLLEKIGKRGERMMRIDLSPPAESVKKSGEKKAPELVTQDKESYAHKVVVIPIQEEDLVRKSKFDFMRRILNKANREGAEAIIFDMDTPGGLAWETTQVMMDDLQKITVPTYTFVNTRAVSAGALIALASDHIYMRPASSIGAAAPVMGTGIDIPEAMNAKIMSNILSVVRAVCHLKGKNPDIGVAFVDKEKEVKLKIPLVTAEGTVFVEGKILSEKGELLSLDPQQATEIIDGKPVLADGIVQDIDELIEKAGLQGEIITAEALGFELLADWIIKLAPFLLLLGIAGAYLEIKTPGFGIAGATSLFCFAIFFFGHHVAGKLAGYELFGVLILGIILVVLEAFVFPGTLIFGLTGFFLIFGSLLFAMVDKLDLQKIEGGKGIFSIDIEKLLELLKGPAITLSFGLGGALLLIVILFKYLPKTKALNWLILNTSLASGPSLHSVSLEEKGSAVEGLLGKVGVAKTDLRPSGKGLFGDQLVDITTESEFVEKGESICIIGQEGMRIIVATHKTKEE